jgi:hypothetical protein
MIGLTAGLVIEGQTGKSILTQVNFGIIFLTCKLICTYEYFYLSLGTSYEL